VGLAVAGDFVVEGFDLGLEELGVIGDEDVLDFDEGLFEAVAGFEAGVGVGFVAAVVDFAKFALVQGLSGFGVDGLFGADLRGCGGLDLEGVVGFDEAVGDEELLDPTGVVLKDEFFKERQMLLEAAVVDGAVDMAALGGEEDDGGLEGFGGVGGGDGQESEEDGEFVHAGLV
jgi:hypothetical protein